MNKIIQGDCFEVMKTLEEKSIDLIVTDPPYLISDSPPGNSDLMSLGKYNSSGFSEVTNGFEVEKWFQEAQRLMEKMNCFIFCSNKQIAEIMSVSEGLGYYTTLLVWNKTNSAPFANGVWRQDAEFIVHVREKGAYFEGGADIKRKVTQLPTNPSEYGHPTEKPVELLRKFILIGSKAGDTILDTFMGTGSTLVAAKQLNRNSIGIEISPEYCEIARRRLEQDTLL